MVSQLEDWIRRRSDLTRWLLLPVGFVVAPSIAYWAMVVFVAALSFIPSNVGLEAEARLEWLLINVGAEFISAAISVVASARIAPKFVLLVGGTACTAWLGLQGVALASMISEPEVWSTGEVVASFSATAGAITAFGSLFRERLDAT